MTQAVLPKQPAFNVVAVKIIQNDTELKLCTQGPEGCWLLVQGSDTLPGTGKGVVLLCAVRAQTLRAASGSS